MSWIFAEEEYKTISPEKFDLLPKIVYEYSGKTWEIACYGVWEIARREVK